MPHQHRLPLRGQGTVRDAAQNMSSWMENTHYPVGVDVELESFSPALDGVRFKLFPPGNWRLTASGRGPTFDRYTLVAHAFEPGQR